MPSSLNGTGVTFNDGSTLQSGNIPAANLGSGTANVNTVLRGNRTFGAPPAPTIGQVLSATAFATAGGVGCYAFLRRVTSGTSANNSTLAGSSLRFSNASGTRVTGYTTHPTPAGTWRCMGFVSGNTTTGGNGPATSLWLRIS